MAGQTTYIDEYLAVVKPSFDGNAWKQVSGQIQTTLSKPFDFISKKSNKNLQEAQEKLKSLDKARLTALDNVRVGDTESEKLFEQADKEYEDQQKKVAELTKKYEESVVAQKEFANKTIKAGAYLALLSVAVNKAKDAALEMAEAATDISNKFLSQSSMFVDTETRGVMAKFGVNAKTAQVISAAADELDIDLADYSKLTYGQRKAFNELMNYYQEGINNIDPEKLERFNKATQQYQLDRAKFNIKLKTSLSELVAESDGATEVLSTISNAMESISNILSSDAVKTGYNFVMDIINGILKFVTTPLNWLGNMFGSGNTNNTTTNTVTTNTTVNTSGGVNAEQLAVDIGLQVQNAMTRR